MHPGMRNIVLEKALPTDIWSVRGDLQTLLMVKIKANFSLPAHQELGTFPVPKGSTRKGLKV
jgi:hypothetical protein